MEGGGISLSFLMVTIRSTFGSRTACPFEDIRILSITGSIYSLSETPLEGPFQPFVLESACLRSLFTFNRKSTFTV